MKLFVGSIVGFFVFIGYLSGGDGFTITTGTVPNKPKINKQLKLLNTSIETALGTPFLTQATKVAASQDPTIRDAMVAVYGMPFTGLLCIVTNYQSILNKMESQTFTVSGIISILKSACPLNSGTLTNIETAVEAKTVTATLKNFAASVAKLEIANSATLSKQLTTLISGFTTQGGTVSQWAIKGVNKLAITPTIKSDATVTSMAQSVVNYVGKYGPAVIWSDKVQEYIKAFVAGKFGITL
uniref:Secreted protein n=1 Tax=Panagrellus redivivus TaxID=6233 RepID=A0A7E4WAI9_PANRE